MWGRQHAVALVERPRAEDHWESLPGTRGSWISSQRPNSPRPCSHQSLVTDLWTCAPCPRVLTLGLECPSPLCKPSCPQIPGGAYGQKCSWHSRSHAVCLLVSLRPKEGEWGCPGSKQSHSSPCGRSLPCVIRGAGVPSFGLGYPVSGGEGELVGPTSH